MSEYTDDGKVWAYYDVNDTSNATKLFGATTGIPSTIEIDGTSTSRVTNYTFSSTGIHVVKFKPTTTYVGRAVFHTIPRLKELYLPSTITRTDGANENTASIRNCAILDTIGLPSTFTETKVQDFTLLPSLVNINISQLTKIGNYCFCDLPLWTGPLYLPNLTSLGDRPFMRCGITEIASLGSSITSLKGGVNSINAPFLGCTSLVSVTLPASLTTISNFSFYGCSSLTTIRFLSDTPPSKGSSVLQGASLNTIWVPVTTKSAYVTSSGWSSYSSIIQEYPYTGFVYLGSSLLGYAEVERITFTFFYTDGNSIEISIPPNMTWEEFIESGYNGIYVGDWGLTLTFHEDENAEGYVAVNDEQGDPAVVDSTSGGESPEEGDRPTLSTIINDGDYYMAQEYGEDPGGGDDEGDGGDDGSGGDGGGQ